MQVPERWNLGEFPKSRNLGGGGGGGVTEMVESGLVSEKGLGEYWEGWIWASTGKGRIQVSVRKVEIQASIGKVESGRVPKR